MGFLKGGNGFDWNGNGKKDSFDHYMDMNVCEKISSDDTPNSTTNKKNSNEELKGISIGGKPLYDATKDSNAVIIFKCLLVTILCLGGIIFPVIVEMGTLGTLLCIFSGLGLSVLLLKNT